MFQYVLTLSFSYALAILGYVSAFVVDAVHEAHLVDEEHQDIDLGRGGRERRAGALVEHHYVRRRADLPAVAVVEVAQRLLVHEVDRVAEGLEARLQTEGGGRRAVVLTDEIGRAHV